MLAPARLLFLGLLVACSGSGREAVGERVSGDGPSWSVPDHVCSRGTSHTELGEDGSISQFCHDGRDLQGTLVKWHKNSQKAAQGDYVDDRRAGLWTWWHPNGRIATRGHFDRGKESGTWSWWHPNGSQQMRGDHLNGLRMGQWETWYATGQLRTRGDYRNGRKDGRWELFTVGGELARVETWDLGRPVTDRVLIEIDDEGRPVEEDAAR